MGFTEEANQYVEWISSLLKNPNPDGGLQIVYTIHGDRSMPEIELEHLKEIAVCIGMKPLTAIFRRLLSNFRFNRSGFPDLIMWDVRKRKALLVEVKGPGDHLSSKQIMWLEYFARSGIDCEVAYVKAK